jgi:hypothetical protein
MHNNSEIDNSKPNNFKLSLKQNILQIANRMIGILKKTNQLLASSNCAMLRTNLGNHFMGMKFSNANQN